MRILMITDFYHPFVGGVELHVRSLSTALAERGHDVVVATLGKDGLPDFEIDRAGVSVYRMRGSAQRLDRLFSYPDRPWAPPVPDPELTRSLKRIVGLEQPEVVHGHDWLVRSFLPLKRWSKAKLAVSLHYYTLTCAKKSLWFKDDLCSGPAPAKCGGCSLSHYGVAKGVPTLTGNWAAAAAERNLVDMYLPVSQATAVGNGLVGSRWPFRVLPNFIPADGDAPTGDVSSYVAQLPKGDYLLFVGDPRREKGLDVLLRAYAALDSAPPLVLIGKVWREPNGAFPPNVIALENWPNHAVMEAWRRSTLALAPSIWPEPCATVVIEAMTSGRPVIASRIGGMPDMVSDGETGYLVPPGDAKALQEAMEKLLADPQLVCEMGKAGKHRARNFHADTVVPKFESLYDELIGGNRSQVSPETPVHLHFAGAGAESPRSLSEDSP